MKTVFEGQIINVIPVENGLIIAYALSEDEKTTVAYKMVTFEDGKLTNVPKSLYHISKFGMNYQEVERNIKSPIRSKAVTLPNGKIFTLELDGSAHLNESDGTTVWRGTLEYRDTKASSMAISNRSVWACFKEKNVLIRMNLITMKEELRIGGGKDSPFAGPSDLFVEGNYIYVCNADNNTIVRVNTATYVTEVYMEFDAPLLQYIRNDDYEFAVLENGVYLIR